VNSSPENSSVFPRYGLLAVLIIALIGRILLLASGAVSFHSDEAIVALMARHILQGERPVFFYGQAYMGSLDAWLIAIGFRLFGESVLTIRIVQSALYLGVVATGWLAAWKLSGRAIVTNVAGLILAVPTTLGALYTTATLGGYNETLLLGHLLLILGYDVSHDHANSRWRWALLGLCAGIGWWTNGLIIAFALPVGILVAYRLWKMERSQRVTVPILLAIACYFGGSAPWWVFDFTHNHAALAFYLPGVNTEFAGNAILDLPPDQRLIGLLLLGLPTLLGLRFPWSASYFFPPLGIVVIFVYALALYRLAVNRPSILKPDGRGLILGMIGLFCLIFLVSKFSQDPTGRYFLVLALPFGIALGALANRLWSSGRRVWPALFVGLVVAYAAVGQFEAARQNPPGITTQFDLTTHIPNDSDAQLIAFLENHQLYNGYTSYWISFRMAFLSGDRLQYSAALPDKASLAYTTAYERYFPYKQASDRAERVAYITANLPNLDARLEAIFADMGITYQNTWVGPFHVYYDFSPSTPRPPLPIQPGQD
jgi:4-amino-4-deoxy-L-arabinose transferase-like glycosyltransferase